MRINQKPLTLLKFSHHGMSCEINKLMQIPMNNLCYLIKVLSVFPACVIYSPFVALSIFVVLSNFCHLLTLCYLLTFYVTYEPATPRIINGIKAIVGFRTFFPRFDKKYVPFRYGRLFVIITWLPEKKTGAKIGA